MNTLYQDNIVTDNEVFGIFHEISFDAVIRNNTCKRNGSAPDYIWNAQIFISNSSNVDVYGNTVELDASVGWGIALFQDDRGEDLDTTGNYVHDNTIIYLGEPGTDEDAGFSGAWHYQRPGPIYSGQNRFDSNHYYVARPDGEYWRWDSPMTWDLFRAAGQEKNGTVDILERNCCRAAR
jgi:parallel beta-helix repeat protein